MKKKRRSFFFFFFSFFFPVLAVAGEETLGNFPCFLYFEGGGPERIKMLYSFFILFLEEAVARRAPPNT